MREGQIVTATGSHYLGKCLLDTGATHGNYVGRALFLKLPNVKLIPCQHRARLGDGKTILHINEKTCLDIQLYRDNGTLAEVIPTTLYVVDSLGEEAIIGLQDLLGTYFDFFAQVLEKATGKAFRLTVLEQAAKELQRFFLDVEEELSRKEPRTSKLAEILKKARKRGSSYMQQKREILDDKRHTLASSVNETGSELMLLTSPDFGICFADDRVEATLADIDAAESKIDFPTNLVEGEILEPWSLLPELCPEEIETPDPLSFGQSTSLERNISRCYSSTSAKI